MTDENESELELVEDEEKVLTGYNVYKVDGKTDNLIFVGTLELENYYPTAKDVGEKFGEGEFILHRLDSSDSRFFSGHKMIVEVEKWYTERS